MFLLWECSTPFVFLRWVLHTLGRTKDKLYLYNGLTMMAVFFLCRNVLGVGARFLLPNSSATGFTQQHPSLSKVLECNDSRAPKQSVHQAMLPFFV